MPRRLLVRLLASLDKSPLPVTDRVRLELESELLDLLAAHAPTIRRPNAADAELVATRALVGRIASPYLPRGNA